MPAVGCPDCGALIELPVGVRSGDLVECPNCAGHALRVREDAGQWSARLAYRVSCPDCDQVITLADDVKAGDTVLCCGQAYRLTFEFGAFAAEKMQGALMWRDRWFALGVIGATLACLSCLTPFALVALGAIGLGGLVGHLDIAILAALAAFVGLMVFRYRVACRRTP
jgi:mercuric ion transport protein